MLGARRDHHRFEVHFLLILLRTLSKVYISIGSLGFNIPREARIMPIIDSVLLRGSETIDHNLAG